MSNAVAHLLKLEVDALKAKLARNKAFRCAQACDPAMTEIERLNRETHRLGDRAEKAEAEAAALREALELLYQDPGFPNLTAVAKTVHRDALSQPGPGVALLERVKKLGAVAEAVKSMRANLFEHEDALGGKQTGWFTVAPCEYGEAVDEALAALDAPAAHAGDGDAD